MTTSIDKFRWQSLVEPLVLMVVASVLTSVFSAMPPQGLVEDVNMNAWFEADIPRVFANMTDRSSSHGATFKHPLFSLAFWPIVQVVNSIVQSPYTALRIILCVNSAVAVGALWVLLKRFQLRPVDRILFCLLFCAASAFLFWFSVIETFPFGATSILIALHAVYWSRIESPVLRTVLFVFSGIAALAVTITNFGAAIVALLTAHGVFDHLSPVRMFHSLRQHWRPLSSYFVLILVVAAGLALVQDQLFHQAGLFFNVVALSGETQFIGGTNAVEMWARPLQLLIGPIVAPQIDFVTLEKTDSLATSQVVATIDNFRMASIWTGIAVVGWTVLLIGGVSAIVRASLTATPENADDTARTDATRTKVAVLITLVAFFCLHLIYGDLPFLFVAHLLPLLVLVASAAFSPECSSRPMVRNGLSGVLVITVLLAGVSNFFAFQETVVTLAQTIGAN